MKQTVENINAEIASRESQIKQEVTAKMDNLRVTKTMIESQPRNDDHQTGLTSTAKMAFAIAAVSLVSVPLVTATASKFFLGVLCAGSAYVGIKSGHRKNRKVQPQQRVDYSKLMSDRANACSQAVEIARAASQDWDSMMGALQTQVLDAIHDNGELSNDEKSRLSSIVYRHEIINFEFDKFLSQTNAIPVEDVNSFNAQLSQFKSSLLNAINEAVNRQTRRYASLLS